MYMYILENYSLNTDGCSPFDCSSAVLAVQFHDTNIIQAEETFVFDFCFNCMVSGLLSKHTTEEAGSKSTAPNFLSQMAVCVVDFNVALIFCCCYFWVTCSLSVRLYYETILQEVLHSYIQSTFLWRLHTEQASQSKSKALGVLKLSHLMQWQ